MNEVTKERFLSNKTILNVLYLILKFKTVLLLMHENEKNKIDMYINWKRKAGYEMFVLSSFER